MSVNVKIESSLLLKPMGQGFLDIAIISYMAAKDVLAVHGIYPAVVTLKERAFLVKLPVKMEED